MVSQENLQRISDSTVRELAAAVENHNQKYLDQQKAALREELEILKKEMKIVDKTIKVRIDADRVLNITLQKVRRNCDTDVKKRDDQLKQLKSINAGNVEIINQTKMFHRNAIEDWTKKEEQYNRDIKKMNLYIDGLHSTLQQNTIIYDQFIGEEYESDVFEVDWNEYLYQPEQYESDSEFDDE